MKLHNSPASPFVRKVKVAIAELGLSDRIELVPVTVAPGKPNPDYVRVNPLRKVPALALDDGTTVIDSATIVDYLDSVSEAAGGARLCAASGEARWRTLSAQSLANGIMDAAVSMRYETGVRPAEFQWPVWIEDQTEKANNALAVFEARQAAAGSGNPATDALGIDQIALACALGYLDFRFPDWGWRAMYPALADWYAAVATRESMTSTAPE